MATNVGRVELWYPRNESDPPADCNVLQCGEVHVALMDVRAANDITIRYDFERDGYVILMDEHTPEDQEPVRDEKGRLKQKEVAFVPAWATGGP